MATNILKLDTKGACLLCMRICDNPNVEESLFDTLRRYLKIDLLKLDEKSSSLLPSAFTSNDNFNNDVQLSGSLCGECLLSTRDLLHMLQQFENIRGELGKCALKLHKSIKESEKDKVRVREYRKRMMKRKDLSSKVPVNAKMCLAQALRKETRRKCEKLHVRLNSPKLKIPLEGADEEDTKDEVQAPGAQVTVKTKNCNESSPPRPKIGDDIVQPGNTNEGENGIKKDTSTNGSDVVSKNGNENGNSHSEKEPQKRTAGAEKGNKDSKRSKLSKLNKEGQLTNTPEMTETSKSKKSTECGHSSKSMELSLPLLSSASESKLQEDQSAAGPSSRSTSQTDSKLRCTRSSSRCGILKQFLD